MGSGENLGLIVTFSNIVWDWAGWAWVRVLSKTLVIIPSAKQAVRLSGVTQREILTNFVPRCFTGLCILTAMNGLNVGSDEDIADLFQKAYCSSMTLTQPLFMLPELMPVASGFYLAPAGGEAPKTRLSQGHEHHP